MKNRLIVSIIGIAVLLCVFSTMVGADWFVQHAKSDSIAINQVPLADNPYVPQISCHSDSPSIMNLNYSLMSKTNGVWTGKWYLNSEFISKTYETDLNVNLPLLKNTVFGLQEHKYAGFCTFEYPDGKLVYGDSVSSDLNINSNYPKITNKLMINARGTDYAYWVSCESLNGVKSIDYKFVIIGGKQVSNSQLVSTVFSGKNKNETIIVPIVNKSMNSFEIYCNGIYGGLKQTKGSVLLR